MHSMIIAKSSEPPPGCLGEEAEKLSAMPSRAWHISLAEQGPESWRLGGASLGGPVRAENQDFLLTIRGCTADMLLIADGCGGLPHGAAASRSAVMTAASVLASGEDSPPPAMLRRAFQAAAKRLECMGRELNLSTLADGLRTTLLIAIASRHTLHLGYIGDGACDLLHSSGEIQPMLAPHRPDLSDAACLLASLGPTPHGEPSFAEAPFPPCSFVLCGSDGGFDRIAGVPFHAAVVAEAIRCGGDLNLAAQKTLQHFAAARDQLGYVCDDNLSLGILGPGEPPRFTPGFWNHASS